MPLFYSSLEGPFYLLTIPLPETSYIEIGHRLEGLIQGLYSLDAVHQKDDKGGL